MDWKQFFASLVGSLAWPVATVIILILFRPQVGRLLGQIKKLAAAGVNVDFADQLEKVTEQAKRVEAETKGPPPDVVVLDPTVLQLAQKFPEAAVLQEYKELESVLLQIRSRLPDNRPHRNLNEVLAQLNKAGLISGSVIGLFNTIRKARNAVAHSNDEKMTPGEAIELVRETRMLIELLRAVLNKLPKQSD
ncbi:MULTISPECIES: DUF4145 domain-containing protein [unclassified Bradyrhizobium]|uniref:DUF4145 domain-containing protein n=1 Tax=unclassified Bradyrhizobium TaxID=2631580 RepID=UPI0028E90AFB|nr:MULTISPECIES: DUF4145 domain-containing protein [unclassified Bradyrhizobium]